MFSNLQTKMLRFDALLLDEWLWFWVTACYKPLEALLGRSYLGLEHYLSPQQDPQ
jgi:hypothetical protein